MSLETTSGRNVEADMKAALAPHAAKLLPGAEAHLARLFAAEFGNADPALLPGAIAARLEHPEIAAFFCRPTGPPPGSLADTAARFHLANGSTLRDGAIDLAAGMTSPVEAGTPEAQAQAKAAADAQAAEWAKLSPVERLMRLGDAFLAQQAAQNQNGVLMMPGSAPIPQGKPTRTPEEQRALMAEATNYAIQRGALRGQALPSSSRFHPSSGIRMK